MVPPPVCFPFTGGKKQRRNSYSDLSLGSHEKIIRNRDIDEKMPPFVDRGSFDSSRSTLLSRGGAEPSHDVPVRENSVLSHRSTHSANFVPPPKVDSGVEFGSESDAFYNDARGDMNRSNSMTGKKGMLKRSDTLPRSGKSRFRWGYGWGLGKKEKELERLSEAAESEEALPVYPGGAIRLPPDEAPPPPKSASPDLSRNNTKTSPPGLSRRTTKMSPSPPSRDSTKTSVDAKKRRGDLSRSDTKASKESYVSTVSGATGKTPLFNDSSSTLVGSALERKLNDYDVPFQKVDSAPRLAGLRQEMVKEKLDYYLVLSDDAHGTEIVAKSDRRREWITGFDGSAGTAIVSVNHAYLITDSRYWIQAGEQVDRNWTIVRGGSAGVPKDWAEWLLDHAHRNSRIGVDARMLSYEKATMLNTKLHAYGSKLVYPPQNLVDFVWRDKPPRSKEAVFIQPVDFAGESASSKLHRIRKWITEQPADVPAFSRSPPTDAQKHVGTLLTALDQIAWTLNLRGSDIPFNPLFQAYLYVGLNQTILFLDAVKCPDDVSNYLSSLKVDRREYADIWSFLRLRHFGTGKVLISPQTSYAIALMLTSYRYTVTPSRVEHMMAIKNDAELEGLKRAYMRDGCAFIRFLAWLENKINSGFDVTEYEAAMRITEFRRHAKNFMGVAYENISATGPNAALPHYTPRRKTAALISRDTPYLHDSGGQYRDGTCDTTRTVHFGRPPSEQCEAYTKVLQGHIAIDSAIFPEGTSGTQLDVLARKALWKDGMNYLHGTGHGFGSFLTVHEGPHGFSSGIPLQPGHVVTNEPGYYKEGHWGMRIESALFVRRVTTKREYNGPVWLGFERLTYVPVQTRMVKDNLLSKEEKAWIKEHNQRCYDIIAPYLKEDKRALKWLKREAERGIGLAPSAAGVSIEWD